MKRVGLLTCLLLLGWLVSCRPPESRAAGTGSQASGSSAGAVQVRVETDGEPALGATPVIVYLLRDGEGVSGAEVEVTGDMTHAGMVPVIAAAEESEPGLYRADGFEFTMAGDWVVTAEVDLPDGASETAELSVTVPGD